MGGKGDEDHVVRFGVKGKGGAGGGGYMSLEIIEIYNLKSLPISRNSRFL